MECCSLTLLKQTPLYEVYKQYGGKTIDFGGWDLPVQFSGIKQEHEAVRTKAGLFDVSHMGEIEVKGNDSLAFLHKMLTNDIEKIKNGAAQYSAMCYENGGTVDDLLTYKLADNHYLLVVNASNIEKDFEWLQKHASGEVILSNLSEDFAQLALQGPLAEEVLRKINPSVDYASVKYFHFQNKVNIAGKEVLLSRTGYTGEDGFEIYCQSEDAIDLWREIFTTGEPLGVLPCGLGARDTLRFEATLTLYGQELSADISPLEAGIGFAVKVNKEADFIGKAALTKQKEEGLIRKLAGIEMVDRGIPRHGYKVYANGLCIGEVTTGTQSPTLKKNIGLALIQSDYTAIDTEVEVEIRGKYLKAKVTKIPFYKRK